MNRGFGIIEVLVALLLFSVGILAISGIFPLSVRNVETSQDVLIATEILTGTIELLNQPSNTVQNALVDNMIRRDFQPIRELGGAVVPNIPGYQNNPVIPRYSHFERQILTDPMVPSAEFGPRVRVTVTVRWTDPSGRVRNISMPSIIDLNKAVYTGQGF